MTPRLGLAVRTTLITQAFGFIGIGISLISVPLYVQWLGLEGYGTLLTALTLHGYLALADLGLGAAVLVRISRKPLPDQLYEISHIIQAALVLCGILALGVFALGVLLQAGAIQWLHPEMQLSRWVEMVSATAVMSAVTILFSPVYGLCGGIQRYHLAAIYQGLAKILTPVVLLGAAFRGLGLAEMLLSAAMVGVVAGACASIHCWRIAPKFFWPFHRPGWHEVKTQLRIGLKSNSIQLGLVMAGTAPILSVSWREGQVYVPAVSVTLSILSLSVGVFWNFFASLQPAFGQAQANGQLAWVNKTIRDFLGLFLLYAGLISTLSLVGFSRFVSIWTAGHLQISLALLVGCLLIALMPAILAPYRFALTAGNQNRGLAQAELLCGVTALALLPVVVSAFGYEWVGFGYATVLGITSFRITFRDMTKFYGPPGLWLPSGQSFGRTLVAVSVAAGGGYAVTRLWPPLSREGLLVLVASMLFAAAVYLLMVWKPLIAQAHELGGVRFIRRMILRSD